LIAQGEELVCSNYILVETFALVQRRLGIEAVRAFQENVYPILNVEWVDETDHRAGVAAVLAASRRKLSLVDCVSFEVMRRLGIHRVFCFDPHFEEQGFECITIEGLS
jgi:predicted nucleic acid-binding protein